MRYEIRPLGTWIGPTTARRAPSYRFKASWDSTRELLAREAHQLGAALVVLQVDVTEADLRRDGMLRANAKVGFPGVRVSFESRHGPLTYATDAYEQLYSGDPPGWQANIRAIALSLEALRAVDRYGVSRSGEQYRGWLAIEAGARALPARRGLSREEAAKILAVYSEGVGWGDLLADREAIGRAFRSAARATSPDHGGSAEKFARVVEARDRLYRAIGEGC